MRWLILASVIVALFLSVIPLPIEWRWWRPEFVALLVVFWATYYPQIFGIFSAWLCGLALDVVTLSPLGYHSIGIIVMAYLSYLLYQRIRSYAIWQQAAWVFIVIGIYQLFGNWTSGFMGKKVGTNAFLIAPLVTAFLWPIIVILLERIIRVFRLA